MSPMQSQTIGLEIHSPVPDECADVLSPDAVQFVERLVREFASRAMSCCGAEGSGSEDIDAGKFPDFLAETASIREADWSVAWIPRDLQDRRVEITGPTDRKMIINAMNSGANVYMADFEDANSPTWRNLIDGQRNLCDTIDGIDPLHQSRGQAVSPEPADGHADGPAPRLASAGKARLPGRQAGARRAVRLRPCSSSTTPRSCSTKAAGPISICRNWKATARRAGGTTCSCMAQDELGIPRGSIRATVLIETIPAAFEMDEILYELRDHSAGLNCGRWDYIFSIIKKFHKHPQFTMPDRAQVTMTTHGMHSYSLLAIKTCHRRGVHAIGGMAAQIPIKNDPQANEKALEAVRSDKLREVADGHDGTWVAHPGLVELARAAFDAKMPGPHQIDRRRDDVQVTADDLLTVPSGEITERGLCHNIDVGIQYMAAWLGGNGCVPLYHLMEDAATAEISRSQLWQWLHQPKGVLSDGRKVTPELIRSLFEDQMSKMREAVGAEPFARGNYNQARKLIEEIVLKNEFTDFMTLVGYEHLD